jgi:hypothetical protein
MEALDPPILGEGALLKTVGRLTAIEIDVADFAL